MEQVDIDELLDDIDFKRYLLDYIETYSKYKDLITTRIKIKELHPSLTTDYLNALHYHATCELAIKGKPKIVFDSHVSIYQQLIKSELLRYKTGKTGVKGVITAMHGLESLLKLTDKATIKLYFPNGVNANTGDLEMIKDNIGKLPQEKRQLLLEGLKLSQPIEVQE
jgi:hypothetical protein